MKISLFEQNSTQYTVKEIATIIKNQLGFGSKIYPGEKHIVILEIVLDALQDISVKIWFNVLSDEDQAVEDFADKEIVSIESFLLFLTGKVDVTDTDIGLLAVSSALESAQQILKILQDAGISNVLT